MGWFWKLSCGAVILGLAGPVQAFQPIIQVGVSNSSKPSISGVTNLPEDTPLMVDIEVAREDALNPGHIIYPNLGSKAVWVHGGHFTAGPFGPYDPGTYIASVVVSTGALPDNVKPILGDLGEKLTGPNVKQNDLGAYCEVRKSFEVR